MTRVTIALLWLVHWLPVRWVRAIGRLIGRLLFTTRGSRVTRINLARCFPQLSEIEREMLGRQHFEALAISTLELGYLWWERVDDLLARIPLEGWEHYLAIKGSPILLLAPHFVGLNFGSARLAHDLGDCASIYSRHKDALLDRYVAFGRTRFGNARMLARQDGLRPIVRALRDGLPTYFLPDMDFGARDALFVPFFGVTAATTTAVPRLAKLTGAKVLPCVSRMTERGYVMRLYPAWETFPSDDVEADLRRMNEFIEARTREMPEQYLWSHKRFRTRPPGEGKFYA